MRVKEEKRLCHTPRLFNNEIPGNRSLPPSATTTTTTAAAGAPKSISAAAATQLLELAGNNLACFDEVLGLQ
jgi:hypothetical protein